MLVPDSQPTFAQLLDLSEPIGKKERAKLEKRLERLRALRADRVAEATANLTSLVTKPDQAFTAVQIRHEFVRLSDVDASVEVSDRRAPDRTQRPPATRLITSRGCKLRFYLIALFWAQASRANRAGVMPLNELPIRPPTRRELGWISLLASDAEASGRGRDRQAAADKRVRQLKGVLNYLTGEELVRLPSGDTYHKYEGFELMRESGRVRGFESEQYRVPRKNELTFDIPVALFTNGWIQVLEESELAFLLMIASLGAESRSVAVAADRRLLEYGLSRDSYSANRMLARLNLIEVKEDPRRTDHGKIEGYTSGMDVFLHRFDLLKAGFDSDAYETLIADIEYQLSR